MGERDLHGGVRKIFLDLCDIHAARHGQEESPRGIARRQDLCRAEHGREQTLDFLTAAARYEQDRNVVRTDTEMIPRLLCPHLRVHRIDQRVADKGDVRPRRLIGWQLMRKDCNDLICECCAGLCPPLAPRPCRRRNIRKNGDPPLFRPRREPPVKVRIVDDDEHIRTLLLHEPREVIEEGKNASEVQQNRRDAHHVIVDVVLTEHDTRRLHLCATEANERNRGVKRTQFTRKCRPMKIAGGLPRRKHNFQVGKTSLNMTNNEHTTNAVGIR